jgi:hypothetical protein
LPFAATGGCGSYAKRPGASRYVASPTRTSPGLLQTRSHVDCVAEHAEFTLFVADRARDGQARVDAYPQREVATGAFGDALVLAIEGAEDRERRMLRARRMVDLVADRAENGDDGVADVLLDESAGAADLHRDHVPCGAHVLVELFRIQPLGESRESRDIREEDGDLLGLALDGQGRDEPGPAFSTEGEGDGHRGRALRTGDRRSPHRQIGH